MTQHPGDIITVPHAEIDDIDPVIAAFSALGQEDGDSERATARRAMMVDMVSVIRLFAHDDTDMDDPILILQVPITGMTMGLVEDLCQVAINHHAHSRGEPDHAPHDAWDFRRVVSGVHIRPAAGYGNHLGQSS